MTILKFVLSIIFLILTFSTYGQRVIKNYVQNNTVPIFSIDINDSDFHDFDAIGTAIGNSHIVMLGEQDHGDASGYFAKLKLIKYLHERKGFSVLAFENDFFNTNYSWELLKEGKTDIAYFVNHKIAVNWSVCGKESPFFEGYLISTFKSNNPIQIAGFDNLTATPQTLPVLDSLFRSLNIPITQSPEYKSEIFPLLNAWYTYAGDSIVMNKIVNYYTIIRSQLLQKLEKEDFWLVTVDNLIAEMQQFKNWRKGKWENYRDRNIRDQRMAENLKWLSGVKYANQKIIVWAHNYHVSKYAGHYPESYLKEAMTMGTCFTQDSSRMMQTYIIGFTSFSGTAGRFMSKTYKTETATADGFERWINKDYNYAFLDFKKFNNLNPESNEFFFMKCSMTSPFHRNAKAIWNRIFDGVFYIKHTYSCNE